MEDAVVHIDNFNQVSPLLSPECGRGIWAVYDGHGGTEVSILAAEMLHKEIVYFLAKNHDCDVPGCIVQAIKKTDKYICQKSLQNSIFFFFLFFSLFFFKLCRFQIGFHNGSIIFSE